MIFLGFFSILENPRPLCVFFRWSRCLRWNDHYNYTAKPGDRRPAVVGTALWVSTLPSLVFFPGEEEVRHQQRWKKWRRRNSTCDDFCVQRLWWVGTSIGLPTSIFNQRKDGKDGTSTSKTPEDEERSPNFHDRCCLLCFTDAFRTHLQYV